MAAAILRAIASPRVYSPTRTTSSAPWLRSTISCAIRVCARRRGRQDRTRAHQHLAAGPAQPCRLAGPGPFDGTLRARRAVVVGERIARVEDARLLTGRGRYVDDIHAPGMHHAAFVRSHEA